jgi:hypothetical protein
MSAAVVSRAMSSMPVVSTAFAAVVSVFLFHAADIIRYI